MTGIKNQFPTIADDFSHDLCKVPDADFFTGSNVKETLVRIVLHDKDASIPEVVCSQKFALGLAGPPDRNLFCTLHFSFMKCPNQDGGNMTGLRIQILARPIEVGGHHSVAGS